MLQLWIKYYKLCLKEKKKDRQQCQIHDMQLCRERKKSIWILIKFQVHSAFLMNNHGPLILCYVLNHRALIHYFMF
jgi:hypothetical protein